jgi:hypothetical protein
MGFYPSGGSPPKEPRSPHRRRLALLTFFPRFPSGMTRQGWALPSHATSIRAGAFTVSRAFGPPAVRTFAIRRLSVPPAVPLLGFHLTRVFPLPVDGTDLAAPPLVRLSNLRSRSCPQVRRPAALQGFTPQAQWHCLSRGRHPLPRFIASPLTCSYELCPVRAFCLPRAPGYVAAP